ncbi:hypothetical protein ACG7TL_000582 [Trametes sanguinea]
MDTTAFRQVACKCIKRRSSDKLEKIQKEVDILLNLSHPNINTVRAATNDDSFLYIFLELCTGGDLFSYIVSYPESQLCQAEAKYIMYQLLKGLKYLHDRLISHRGPYPRIQIADFGLARPKAYQETFNVCGTVSYLPPEGILALDHKHLSYVGMPADCWSSGVIMYIMLAGSHPFDYGKVAGESELYSYRASESHEDSQYSQESVQVDQLIKKRIVHGEVEFPEYHWDKMPHGAYLILRLSSCEVPAVPDHRGFQRGRYAVIYWYMTRLNELLCNKLSEVHGSLQNFWTWSWLIGRELALANLAAASGPDQLAPTYLL